MLLSASLLFENLTINKYENIKAIKQNIADLKLIKSNPPSIKVDNIKDVIRFKKALIELRKAWEKEKKDVVITKHLALVYQKLNNDSEAQKYFVEALKNCTEESQRKDIIEVMESRIMKRLPASLLRD